MTTVAPIAVDLYSEDRVDDFAAAKAAGIQLIIHKATEGATYKDPLYRGRRQAARAAGLLWSAYHFATGAPVEQQVANFFSVVYPDDDPTLRLVLDWESTAMTVAAAKEFMAAVDSRSGHKTVVYSYSAFLAARLGNSVDAALGVHPLWLAAYRDTALPPAPQPSWSSVALWQYTDGQDGAHPRAIPGIPGNALGQLDINMAPNQTPEQFRAAWLSDQDHPHDLRWVQARLAAAGLYRATIDGLPGPATTAAMAAYIEAHP